MNDVTQEQMVRMSARISSLQNEIQDLVRTIRKDIAKLASNAATHSEAMVKMVERLQQIEKE